jgi:hypothetical protein
MSTPKSCCAPCPDVITVNIPGVEGPDGTDGKDGTNGLNSFTNTTADFVVPGLGSDVTINVVDSTWMLPGQTVFITGAGNFTVVSKPTTTSATLNYDNVGANTATGNTISTGAGVSPSGKILTALPLTSNYQSGGSQAMTITPAQVLNGTITLAAAGTYLLLATGRFDFSIATFNSEQILTFKLRRTNNTPGDISNALAHFDTGLTVLVSKTMAVIPLPPVSYTATAGDIIQPFASLNGLPYSGSLIAVEVGVMAVRIF